MSEQSQKDSVALAQAAGPFKRFLSLSIQMGNVAEDQLQAIDDALDEARAETAVNGS
jgi:hypothetical protein